eukprot:TRINITY_DN1389_c0_g1_i3.p1 TRINITY_DN1389_c0_g1~~TRINITY_DN1389_c0_g1_i3.p1  ORF type:complete len:271 (-),score=37.12 TRINITY_DN1389_c0_g1_i3:59-871(-)
MIGAYCIFKLGWTSQKVKDTLSLFIDHCREYRDASSVEEVTYSLSVLHCFDALEKANKHKFLDLEAFDLQEYTFYEQVENGDLNWILPGKILAFSSPGPEQYGPGREIIRHSPKYYIDLFKEFKVDTVIRLNKIEYDAKLFQEQGIKHHDLYFTDGTPPPMDIVYSFLAIVEASKVVAVHCKQGLGRTGTLIGCYLMKHYRFSAAEAIAFLRIQRPGSVVGPQQEFLHKVESEMQNVKATNKKEHMQGEPGRKRKCKAVSIPLKTKRQKT